MERKRKGEGEGAEGRREEAKGIKKREGQRERRIEREEPKGESGKEGEGGRRKEKGDKKWKEKTGKAVKRKSEADKRR